jgi:hypothetical protein
MESGWYTYDWCGIPYRVKITVDIQSTSRDPWLIIVCSLYANHEIKVVLTTARNGEDAQMTVDSWSYLTNANVTERRIIAMKRQAITFDHNG